MVKSRRISKDVPIGSVNEARIHTDGGLVIITNHHLGESVYEVRIAFEGGEVIESFGEMTRGRSWGMYVEKCAHYEKGANPISEGNSIVSGDLEAGLPDDDLSYFNF